MTKDKGAGRKARANKPVEDADFGRPSLDPCQRNEWYSIRKKAQTFALLCLAGLLSWFATPISVGASSGLDVGFNASEVPQLINYSGKLSGAEGEPLPTGDYTLSFSIYDHAKAVPCGVADDRNKKKCALRVWGPQIFDGNDGVGHGDQVPVVKGVFSAILGPYDINGDPIAQAFTSSNRFQAFTSPNRFIEITFKNDAPNLPRQQVFSTPFALRSSGGTPVGGIIMFSGKTAELPENWRVCRGQVVTDSSSPLNGKQLPDLRGLFVRGASNLGEVGNVDNHGYIIQVDPFIMTDLAEKSEKLLPENPGELLPEQGDISPLLAPRTREEYLQDIRRERENQRAIIADMENQIKQYVFNILLILSGSGPEAQTLMERYLNLNMAKLKNRLNHVNLHYIIRIK